MSEQFIEVDPSIGEKVNNIKWDKDNINPDHYKSSTSLECIEAMQIAFGREAVLHFCLCNAWKYIWRWKNKNGTEDLDKAQWYIHRGLDILNDNETPALPARFQKSLIEMDLYLTKYMEDNA